MNKGNAKALLPIGVFVVLYMGLGIMFEYVMKFPMGFYNIPIVVIFMVALLVAFLQDRKRTFGEKLGIAAAGSCDVNIFTMLIIFLEAGIFVGVVGRSSAESVAYFILSMIPARFAVAVLFVVSCFVSLAMGTSVGTVTLLVPIAAAVSKASGFAAPLCVGTVVGGAMFGDNLSFISDTTIAACNGQGCEMRDKFRANIAIALPAALVTLALVLFMSLRSYTGGDVSQPYSLLLAVPYVIVLACSLLGVNVFLVLMIGVVSGSAIMLGSGKLSLFTLLSNMGSGAAGMFETGFVAILVSAICALIRNDGGFDAILYFIRTNFKSRKSGMFGMGLLVSLIDVATANNTVAIVMANPIAKEISESYGIEPKRTASILDVFSCVVQGLIPYGAQILVAISSASEMGVRLNSFSLIPHTVYPFVLLACMACHIVFGKAEKG